MKKILILLFISQIMFAQKHDYNWFTGYEGDISNEIDGWGVTKINFTDETVRADYIISNLYLNATSTSISDKEGNLLFYSNGIAVYNRLHKPMKNSDSFNISKFNDSWKKYGLPLPQGIIALPDPSDSDKYYLLYPKIRRDKAKKEPYASGLNYATIDMKGDNGNGAVILKDVALITDTLNFEGLTACKHGNGRDWWIVIPTFSSKFYQRILLSTKGLQVLKPIEVSDTLKSALTQIAFSPDGSKLIRNADKSRIEDAIIDIFDFDRCTGLIYNQKRIKNPVNNKEIRFGMALSPNGKYAYICHTTKIIQLDLTAKDIATSGDTIAYYDGYVEDGIKVLETSFFFAQLAPDGKIYINSGSGVKRLHVIHQPNRKGADCKFQQRGLPLKSWNARTLPNYPNYRLGPIDGSPCDTLGIDNIPVALFRYDKDTLNTFLVEFTDLSHHEPAKWEWDFGDGSPKSATQEPVHTYKSKGEYQVCLTVSNANGKHTACKKVSIDKAVGTEEITEGSIEIYPNPVHDILTIEATESLDNQTIIILDMLGKTILSQQLSFGKNNINMGDFPSGTYILKIGNTTRKLVKM